MPFRGEATVPTWARPRCRDESLSQRRNRLWLIRTAAPRMATHAGVRTHRPVIAPAPGPGIRATQPTAAVIGPNREEERPGPRLLASFPKASTWQIGLDQQDLTIAPGEGSGSRTNDRSGAKTLDETHREVGHVEGTARHHRRRTRRTQQKRGRPRL